MPLSSKGFVDIGPDDSIELLVLGTAQSRQRRLRIASHWSGDVENATSEAGDSHSNAVESNEWDEFAVDLAIRGPLLAGNRRAARE